MNRIFHSAAGNKSSIKTEANVAFESGVWPKTQLNSIWWLGNFVASMLFAMPIPTTTQLAAKEPFRIFAAKCPPRIFMLGVLPRVKENPLEGNYSFLTSSPRWEAEGITKLSRASGFSRPRPGRAHVFAGETSCLWVQFLRRHHQRDQRQQRPGPIKWEETGGGERVRPVETRQRFVNSSAYKAVSRIAVGRLHLGDSTAVGEEVGETFWVLIGNTWDTMAACYYQHWLQSVSKNIGGQQATALAC